ncbi:MULTISPECIES: hydantoinase/oxoprolinase family protein [unclassified Devosia]|uniref:hydantoinase/oxoprolinase family protein n=1 Tax=unclassified Devosia TaxID=196773 RepID=UPI000B07DC17|nr:MULTISPECIES: hydantoinase/oxoprolinase family protein [unclassified Devosia]MBN9307430.1 hydantoinase/oxoprolinase family protein [Devosia sp.]
MYRIGIDIGGTFTDCVLVDEASGSALLHKLLTTPEDPSDAVLDGVAALLAMGGVGIGDVSTLVHGTTLVTNALIERRGVRAGMLVTAGMRDILDIGRERRYDLFDLRLAYPEPVIPRRLRRELDERISSDGAVTCPLAPEAVRDAARALVEDEAVEAIAICFLNSYRNPVHEQQAAGIIAEAFPGLPISTSAEVFPYSREYERWTTAAMNAYVQPLFDRYVARIEERLTAIGFGGRLHIMTSSGGMVTPATARRFPIRILESGPAAGALMSAYHGRVGGIDNLLSFDMGGTTAKGALVRAGQPLRKYELEVVRVHQFKAGSGLPAKAPVIDMIEIGAGGGSLASIDQRGVIAVGPRGAGARPGPACYGRGGTLPTLTDANLVLGYYDAETFLGGSMRLDLDAARRAIADHIGTPLGLDVVRAAWGIHEAVNENVASAFRIHASERAFDYRQSSMVAFGGSGPAHAARIAAKLNVPRIVLPPGAGVMSALGLLRSPFAFETARSQRTALAGLDTATYAETFAEMERQMRAVLDEAGIAAESVTIRRRLDMRYAGQGYEVEVEAEATPDGLAERFYAAYRAVFSAIVLDEPLEIVNWKLEASGPEPMRDRPFRLDRPGATSAAPIGERLAYFPATGLAAVPVYDRYRLAVGTAVAGPAIVEERESTTVLGPGNSAHIDPHLNLVIDIGKGEPAP